MAELGYGDPRAGGAGGYRSGVRGISKAVWASKIWEGENLLMSLEVHWKSSELSSALEELWGTGSKGL